MEAVLWGAQLALNVARRRHRATVMANLVGAGSELSLPLFQREAIEFTRTRHWFEQRSDA